METKIPEEFETLLTDRLASGKYQSMQEVIRRAFHLWQEQEEKEDALLEALQVGLDQLESGDALTISNEQEHAAFFADFETRVLKRLEDKNGKR